MWVGRSWFNSKPRYNRIHHRNRGWRDDAERSVAFMACGRGCRWDLTGLSAALYPAATRARPRGLTDATPRAPRARTARPATSRIAGVVLQGSMERTRGRAPNSLVRPIPARFQHRRPVPRNLPSLFIGEFDQPSRRENACIAGDLRDCW
jgi:hypothetical protein